MFLPVTVIEDHQIGPASWFSCLRDLVASGHSENERLSSSEKGVLLVDTALKTAEVLVVTQKVLISLLWTSSRQDLVARL